MEKKLQHAGIPGMHWGVRSGSSKSNHGSNVKNKKLKDLSNDEIQTYLNQRLIEKKYKELHPSTFERGKNLVSSILANSAKKKAQKFADEQHKMEMEYIANRNRKMNFYKI